jgi:hypothetical protein
MTEREAIDLLSRFEKAAREHTAFPTSKAAAKNYDNIRQEVLDGLLPPDVGCGHCGARVALREK